VDAAERRQPRRRVFVDACLRGVVVRAVTTDAAQAGPRLRGVLSRLPGARSLLAARIVVAQIVRLR
jgi:hypothetical protein